MRLLLLLLTLALAACGGEAENGESGDDGGQNGTNGPAPRTLVRAPFELPAKPATTGEKVDFLLDLLASGDLERLTWAWQQLERAGPAAAPSISARLETALAKNPYFAENLLLAVSRGAADEGILPHAISATKHEDGRVRIAAARALGAIPSKKSIPPLLGLLNDPLDKVALAAVESIEKLASPEGARRLLGRFPDGLHPAARPAAAIALRTLLPRKEGDALLLSLLADEDAVLSVSAARALVRDVEDPPEAHQSAVRSRMRELLGDTGSGVMRFAIKEVLAAAGDPETRDTLIADSSSGNPTVAADAIRLLGHYSEDEVRKALWKLAGLPAGDLRREALYALYRSADADTLPHIYGLLDSPEADDRFDAALLLGLIRVPESVEPVTKALAAETDSRALLKLSQVLALVGMPESALQVVKAFARETEEDPGQASLAYNLAATIRRFPEISEAAESALVREVRSTNPAIRLNAGVALGYHGRSPAAKEALAKLLTDPSVDVRRVAVRAWLNLRNSGPGPLRAAYATEPAEDVAKDMNRCAEQLRHRFEE